MSGTSLDGIDVALLEVEEVEEGEGLPGVASHSLRGWSLEGFRAFPYSDEQRGRIREALQSGGPEDLARLHTALGRWFAKAALAVLEAQALDPGQISLIGSHGQTIWHDPPREGRIGSSLQLGCPSTLAERTGIPVVSDFRSRDLAAGGHGAPLVPWADQQLFSSPDCSMALQNLGGMGNVTWLPKTGDESPVLAFDTGPGVVLLDYAAERASGGRLTYDRDGFLARKGRVSDTVLGRLMDHPFFLLYPPKSTGRETF